MERKEILERLAENLAKAHKRRTQASADFDDAIKAPSGLPHPDGIERTRSTSKEYGSALNGLSEALRSQRDFMLHGIVPPGLDDEP